MILKKQIIGDEVKCLVESSNIIATSYNTLTEHLKITFKGGTQYMYSNVYRLIYEGFENATSQGSYFNQFIKQIPAIKMESEIDINNLIESFNIPGDELYQELRELMYNTSVDITDINGLTKKIIVDLINRLRDIEDLKFPDPELND